MTLTRLDTGGRYWVRTSDLFGVNEARYHCANRPLERRPPYLSDGGAHDDPRGADAPRRVENVLLNRSAALDVTTLPRPSNNSVEPADAEV